MRTENKSIFVLKLKQRQSLLKIKKSITWWSVKGRKKAKEFEKVVKAKLKKSWRSVETNSVSQQVDPE